MRTINVAAIGNANADANAVANADAYYPIRPYILPPSPPGILSLLAITMRTGKAAATGNANVDANAIIHADTMPEVPSYDDPPNPSDCGEVKYKANRIVGGQEAKFGSHPWLGLLWVEVPTDKHQICGCNVLSTKWCVTAAHCMYNEDTDELISLGDFSVRFGEHDIPSTSEPLQLQELTFEDRKIHPQYDNDDEEYKYDITMMKVSGTINYADHIVPICLPKSNLNILRTANVAGWGISNYDQDISPNILQEVDVQIKPDNQCTKWWKEAGENYPEHITHFCAGYKRGVRDTCKGDSGGALTVKEDGKHVAVGLVSYGEKCGYPNLPGVYVRVQYFVPWILECMQ